MKKFTIIAVILLTVNLMFAQIINIPDDYPTIQQGIDAANDGDTILVQPGLYLENLVMYNDNAQGITLASLFLTTGDTSYIAQTIIDGGQEGSVISIEVPIEVIDVEIKGFTIQNGKALDNSPSLGQGYGGGIYISDWIPNYPQPNNIVLSNLIICDNIAHHKGGGVYIGCMEGGGIDSTSYVYIKDVVIQHNGGVSAEGSGIYCENINPILEDVVIKENFSYAGGQHAGVGGYFYQSKPRLQNVRVISNHDSYKINESPVKSMKWEVGQDNLVFDHSSPLLQNILIADQHIGIYLRNSEAIIYNSTMTYHGYCALDCDSSSVTLINCIFWENGFYNSSYPNGQVLLGQSTCSLSYCAMQDGINGIYNLDPISSLQWLEGNISDDPLFEDTGDSTCQLSSISPCIDAGTPDTTGLNMPLLDLMGNYRMWDGNFDGDTIVDMGACEFGAIPVGIEKKYVQSSPEGMPLAEVRSYPNPVSENCTIEFELAKPARVSIQIYNNIGKLLIEPRDQIYSTGSHQVNLNLIDLNDGIYFCRIRVGNEMVTKKIIKF